VLTCPTCQGPTRIIAAITEPRALRAILRHVREPPARAPPSGAREPMLEDDAWYDPTEDS